MMKISFFSGVIYCLSLRVVGAGGFALPITASVLRTVLSTTSTKHFQLHTKFHTWRQARQKRFALAILNTVASG